jgi:tRNA nucleotidyltransferase (CCA-adding enzyme)
MKVYRVGGSVRDELLELSIKDKDYVVVDSTVEEMLKLGFQQVGKDFPVFLHPETREEFALARQERKSGKGYTGFEVNVKNVKLEDDLKRRDITINSIAIDEFGVYHDPCKGLQDIENKIIRHNSNAFTEDPLRVLRAARFYARFYHLGFNIAPETVQALQQVTREELLNITPERVWLETIKALQTKNPEIYFWILLGSGVLEIVYPEIYALVGQTHNKIFHAEGDAFEHSMLVLQVASEETEDTEIRFAALVHDLGKGITPKDKLPKHHDHEEKGVLVVKNMCERLNTSNKYKDLALIVTGCHLKHHKLFYMTRQKVLKLLNRIDAFRKPERFYQFLEACKADHRGRICEGKNCRFNEYPQADYLIECREAIVRIDIKVLKAKGYNQNRFLQDLHKLRLNAISMVKNKFKERGYGV